MTICVNSFFNIYHLKTDSNMNVCPNSSRERIFLSESKQYLKLTQKVYKHLEEFKQLLKKISKLNRISFDRSHRYRDKFSVDLYEVIIKYSNNLTHIQFENYASIKTHVGRKFFDKFGHKLISITYPSSNIYSEFSKAPNIEELTVYSFDLQLSQIQFNRLKRFKLTILRSEYLDSFVLFIENNGKTLKHLDFSCYEISDNKSVKKLLKMISKTINLNHLGIDNKSAIIDKSLTNYWNEIAINCKQLKSLKLHLHYYESLQLNREMFSILKELKRLELSFSEEVQPDFKPIEDLVGFEKLTHLTIRVKRDTIIEEFIFEEKILTDIDIKFPKLKYLKFNCPFNASQWTAQVLSKIANLETIELAIKNEEIGPPIERQLIKNCKHFKSFKILRNFFDQLGFDCLQIRNHHDREGKMAAPIGYPSSCGDAWLKY